MTYWRRSRTTLGLAAIAFAGLMTAMGLPGQTAYAEESASSAGNIGFMKNPPQDLQAKFPMCEEFLDVQWLDMKYMVGYAIYDAFVRKRASDPPVRKRVHAVVAMPFGVPGRYDYDAYEFARQGKLKELFALIKSGQTMSAGFAFSIGDDDARINLHPGGALSYGERHPLLSDNRKTVCIVYPAQDRAWIIEAKSVERAYSEDQIEDLLGQFRLVGIKTPLEFFKHMWVLDFNEDGVGDFFRPRNLIYSQGDRWVQVKEDFVYPLFIYRSSASKQECGVDKTKMNFDLTTDGRNYFAAGCNWRDLSLSRPD